MIDIDIPAGERGSGVPAADNTHYILRTGVREVWPLRFPDGTQPPDRLGSGAPMEVQVLVGDATDNGAQVVGSSARRRRALHAAAQVAEGGNGGSGSADAGEAPQHIANLEAGAAGVGSGSMVEGSGTSQLRKPRQQQRQGSQASGVEEALAKLHDRRMGPAGSRHRAKPQATLEPGASNATLQQERHGVDGASTGSSSGSSGTSEQQPEDAAAARLDLEWLRRHRQQRRRRQQQEVDPGATLDGGSSSSDSVGSSSTSTDGAVSGAVEDDSFVDRLTVLSWRLLPTQTKPKYYLSGSSSTTASRSGDTSGAHQFVYNTNRLRMDDVSTVIFITNMCGYGPAMTVEVSGPHGRGE